MAKSEAPSRLSSGKEGVEGVNSFLFRESASGIFDFNFGEFVASPRGANLNVASIRLQSLAAIANQLAEDDRDLRADAAP